MALKTPMSATTYLALPVTNQPMQLLDGEILMSPAPELYHQDIVLYSATLLRQVAPEGKVYLSPVDVYFDEENVTQPDVVWLAPNSKCIAVEGKYLRGAPDLIIEVLSPSTAGIDKGKKFRLYEQHGVREYWTVEPTAQYSDVWVHDGDHFQFHGSYGPGEVFASSVLSNRPIEPKAVFGIQDPSPE
jgi:Uma2 family endonuclease